jgi:transposase
MINKISIIDLIKETIFENKNIGQKYLTKHFNSIYSLDFILQEIIFVLKTGVPWRNLRSNNNIHWNTVYFHFNRLIKNDIFSTAYSNLHSLYISKIKKINGIVVDSSFFQNKFGKNNISRNKFYKNKNGYKLSLLTDLNGIPFSLINVKSSVHDCKIFEEHKIDIDKFNKYIPSNNSIYFLADKAYVSKNINNYFRTKKIKVLIPNKKNKIGNRKHFTADQKEFYKKRLVIERLFMKIKRFRRINMIFESNIATFNEFIFLSLIYILDNFMEKKNILK